MIIQTCIAKFYQIISHCIDIFSLEPTRVISPDRSMLEEIILPYFAKDRRYRTILFVGCAAYTQWYEELFQHQEYWTIDPKRVKRQYGSKRHVTASIAHIGRYVTKDYFDLIIINGVIGFGLNRPEAIEQALEACYDVLAPRGILLIGWNDTVQRAPLDIRTTQALGKFREYAFAPLQVCHYRTEGSQHHTFSFYRKD